MRFYSALLALAGVMLAGLGAQQAWAQNVGSLRGTVTDPSAAVVPDTTVVATGNGVTRSGKSDGQGHYTLPNLPPGKYSIRADANGFVTYTKSDVDVSGGQTNSLDIALQIAAEAQQVSVQEQSNAAISVDSSANVSALVLKDADIDALPDDPDDLQSDLEALAGPAAGPNGAQFFVDGFSGGQLPPKSSIREIRINSNPFSAEYDQPGFGRVEILTRPGTDNYHGQAFINYGDRIFDSRNPLLTGSEPGYHSLLGTANVGGPLGKKTSFFIDYNRRAIVQNALVVGEGLTGLNGVGGIPTNCISQSVTGEFVPVSLNCAIITPNAFWQISPRLDYAISQSNTLVIRFNHTQASNLGGVGQFALPSQEIENAIRNNQVQITETAVLGTIAVDETRFQFRDTHTDGQGLGDFGIPGINVSGAFNSGGAPYTANNAFNKGYELQNIVTTTRGKHALKIGFRARQTDTSILSNSNFNGTYTFNGPNPSSGLPVCQISGQPAAATSINVFQQTELGLSDGIPIQTLLAEGCGPSQVTLSSGIPYIQAREFDLGVFIQDDWRVAPNFTVNAGLRYETQNDIGDHLDLGPRLGIAWAPGAKGKSASKTVIRSGYGIFFSRFPVGDVLNTLRYDGFTQTNYVVTAGSTPNAAQLLAYYPLLPPLSLLQGAQVNQAIYTTDSSLRAPYMGQFAFEVDRQLPGRTQLSVNYVNTRGVHVLRQRDINAPLTFGPDAYVGPTAANGDPLVSVRPFTGTDVPGATGDIYQYESSGTFKQTQLTVNANTRLNSHLQIQGYYVYGQAHTNANGFLMNQYNANLDWGRAAFDIRNRGYFGGSIGLPFGLNLNPFMTIQSGSPFNVTLPEDFDGDGIYNARPTVAQLLASGEPGITASRFAGCLAPNAASAPYIPVDCGEGPAQVNLNLRLSRTWGWGERVGANPRPQGGGFPGGGPGGFGGGRGGGGGGGFGGGGGRGGGGFGGGGRGGFGNFGGGNSGKRYNLTATITARNVLNYVNYNPPSGILGSPTFGQSTSVNYGGGAGFGGNNGAAGNRKVELQLRFQF